MGLRNCPISGHLPNELKNPSGSSITLCAESYDEILDVAVGALTNAPCGGILMGKG